MKPRAFCELPAGLAALSLRLHGGPYCRPPISRMGNKAGYAEVILAALGLRSGQGAGAYVWAEADPDVRALLRAYPDPEMLRRIADIIRGWKDEEPRALWERLRAERRARPKHEAVDPAAWIVSMGWGNGGTPGAGMGWNGGYSGPGNARGNERYPDTEEPHTRCHRLAEYAQVVASNRLIHVAGPDLRNTGVGGTTFGGEAFATPAGDVAGAFERVAGWSWVQARSVLQKGERAGYMPGGDEDGSGRWVVSQEGVANAYTATASASRWPPVAVLTTLPTAAELSAMLGTPGDLEGVVVYMDPPYVGTTGYLSDLPREDVVRLAREYDAAGAVVCVSEAEPVIDGWHAIDIAGGRKGQKRTFSKQQREVLTMNREPQHRVATQAALFGAS